MNAPALLRELSTRGATVALEGEALRVQPSRVLTDELRAAIRCHKSELLQFLTRENVSREYSQPRDVAADALAKLSREVAAARRPDGLIQMNARVLAAWRDAEATTEMPLTLSGAPRDEPDAHKLREAVLEVNAGACAKWSGAHRRELAMALVRLREETHGADAATAPLRTP